jgi:hypothetical protein
MPHKGETGRMSEARRHDRTWQRYESASGKRALLDTWTKLMGSPVFDYEYVRDLEKRVVKAEERIRNGL